MQGQVVQSYTPAWGSISLRIHFTPIVRDWFFFLSAFVKKELQKRSPGSPQTHAQWACSHSLRHALYFTLTFSNSVCCLILCLKCKIKDMTSYKSPQNTSHATKLDPTFGGQNLRDVCTSVTTNIINKWIWILIPQMSAFKEQAPDKRSIFRSHHQGLTQQITPKETDKLQKPGT